MTNKKMPRQPIIFALFCIGRLGTLALKHEAVLRLRKRGQPRLVDRYQVSFSSRLLLFPLIFITKRSYATCEEN